MDVNSPINPIVIVKGSDKKPPFFKRIQAPFSKLSLPNKKIASVIAVFVLVFGVGLGVFLTQRQTQLRPRASENGVDLKIQPETINATVNQEFSVDVVLDAKQASASGAQVKVTFDPQKLQLVNSTIGSFMPVVLQQITASAGAVEFVVGSNPAKNGSGSIATLRFKALADQTTSSIAFDAANTIVTVLNINQNQAGDLMPATVKIGVIAASPTPDALLPDAGFSPDSGNSLINDLIAYWNMDETTGNISADLVSGYNASWHTTQVVDGKIGKAQNVWASNSWLSVEDPSAFSTDYMTVAGWVKPTRFGNDNFASIFNYRPSTNDAGMTLEYAGYSGLGTGQLQCQVNITAANSSSQLFGIVSGVDQKLSLNAWNHVACSYDGTSIKMYLNGELIQSRAASGKMRRASTGMNAWIGRNLISNAALYGHVDELGYWARALTSQEITDLYNGGQGNTYSLNTGSTQPENSLLVGPANNVSVGQEFNIPLYARSDTENANLFVAKISYPANLLEVVSINDDNSFITTWAEQFYDNQTGQMSLIGGVPSPGYKSNNTNAKFAEIRFRAKASGTALIDMTSQSQIFSNNTNQNILQKTQDLNLTISGTGTASPSPISCQSNSQCSSGYYCQSSSGACQDMPGGVCIISGTCVPNSSKPSPSIFPDLSPSPTATAGATPNCAVLKGDGNSDCVVNLTDLSIMLSNFSATNPIPAGKQLLDFNNDNRINTFDFSSMADKLFQLGIIKRRS